MEDPKLYPLQFVPQLKEKVWGGSKLKNMLDKKSAGSIGESWELSGVAGSISVVSNGALQGQEITQLIEKYKEKLVGERVYKKFGSQFPLLFKFIDAAKDLSVQLHPDDALAKSRHNSFGKTEMWYILQADKNARLILGFNQKLDKSTYSERLAANQITSVLHFEKVEQGEAYFIEPGLVHAIGAGVLLAEIQQTSDITYRIYDWNRPGTDGKMRQLHTEEALDAIKFEAGRAKLDYSDSENERVLLVSCPYFVTQKLKLTQDFNIQNFQKESYKVYMCTEGSGIFQTETEQIVLKKGQTLFMPACISNYTIKTQNGTFLEVYIP